MNNKVIAIIPARGGSKSISYKNIKVFAGKPLVYWTAKAANDSEIVRKVVISTDSEKIKRTIKKFNLKKVKVIERSRAASLDNSPSEMALIETAKRYDFKDLVFLQATNPFIKGSDIDSAYNLYKNGRYDSVFSAVHQKRFLWDKKRNSVFSLNYDYKKRPMRQNFRGFFVENGAIFITSKNNLLKYKNRLSEKIGIYPMPPYSYFELDEPADWEIAEAIFAQNRPYIDGRFDLSNIELLVLDVDGVLTDGGVYYSKDGERMLKFSRIDGKGIELFLNSGRKLAVISAEDSSIARKRLEKLKIKDYFLGVSDKLKELKKYLTKNSVALKDTAYIGDDVQDLGIIEKAGFSACPQNAVEGIRNKVDYICKKSGGNGAVREVIDLILRRR